MHAFNEVTADHNRDRWTHSAAMPLTLHNGSHFLVTSANSTGLLGKHRSLHPLPRVREKHLRPAGPFSIVRSTPARAGKTMRSNRRPSPHKVHSRACGKNPIEGLHPLRATGPLPRVREKLLLKVIFVQVRRSTPARAGKTRRGRRPRGYPQVHSRACGKNVSFFGEACGE